MLRGLPEVPQMAFLPQSSQIRCWRINIVFYQRCDLYPAAVCLYCCPRKLQHRCVRRVQRLPLGKKALRRSWQPQASWWHYIVTHLLSAAHAAPSWRASLLSLSSIWRCKLPQLCYEDPNLGFHGRSGVLALPRPSRARVSKKGSACRSA